MQDVAVDACCLINLCAAGKILSLSSPSTPPRRKGAKPAPTPKKPTFALDLNLYIPAKVGQEVLYIMKPDDDDKTNLVKAEIDLGTYTKAGILHPCDLEGEAETELFVKLATKLDDGEAACFAIAKARGWLLATDDRPATRLADQEGVTVITTPELVKRWAEKAKAKDAEVSAVLQSIQTFARFVPRKSSALYAWWVDLAGKAK